MFRRMFTIAAIVWLASAPVYAQGRQSGALGGRLASADGQPLSGATVTVASPALQGQRTVVADVNGVYRVAGLPPGEYVVTFEMNGMTRVVRRASISLGGDVTMDQTLAVVPVRENVD